MKLTHQVTILGQQYNLRTEASSEQVQEVVDFIHQMLEEIATHRKTVDTLDIVVLAIVNVAGSYLHLKKNAEQGEERLARLLRRLDQTIPAERDA